MIQTIIEKLMGKAGEGNRKMAYGTLALVLLFVFMMWAPGVDEETRRACLITFGGVVAVVVAGNAVEHREKAKEAIAMLAGGAK